MRPSHLHHAHTHTHTHTYIYIYIYTHIYTYVKTNTTGDEDLFEKKRAALQQRMTRRDGTVMSLAASKRASELQKDMNAWEENRLFQSGVVRKNEVCRGVGGGGGQRQVLDDVYIYIDVYIYVYIQTAVHTSFYTHTYTYTPTHTHTHTHTHRLTLISAMMMMYVPYS